MKSSLPKPVIEIIAASLGGGYRIGFSDIDLFGTGPTLALAITNLNTILKSLSEGQKGEVVDDVAYQEKLARDDPFLRGRYADYADALLSYNPGSYPYSSI